MNDTRVTIVTGAAGGIGEGITKRLADNGCRVALIDIDAGRCAAATIGDAGRAIAVQGDVSDAQAVTNESRRSFPNSAHPRS